MLLLAYVRPLQQRKAEAAAEGGSSIGADYLIEGIGNFGGHGLVGYLETQGYQCAHGQRTDSNFAKELIEILCLSEIGRRFLGVVWHVGGPGDFSAVFLSLSRSHHTKRKN